MKLHTSVLLMSTLAFQAVPWTNAGAEPGSNNEEVTIPGWPLEVGTSIWTRYEMRENYDKLGVSRGRFQEGDFAVYRARLTLKTAAINIGADQKVTVHFCPQADGFWGEQPSTVSNPNLGVYEAFLRLDNALLTLDVGHFAMNYGDALVIGDLRWHQTARSFDGARLRLKPGGAAWIDLFFTQLDEGLLGPDADAFAGDVYFTGLYASFGGLISDKTTIEPYVLAQIWTEQEDGSTVVARPATQATVGLRALQKYGWLDVRFEGGVQFGKRRLGGGALNPDVLAFQIDGEVGFTFVKGLRLSLEGLFASGDNPDTDDKVEGYDEKPRTPDALCRAIDCSSTPRLRGDPTSSCSWRPTIYRQSTTVLWCPPKMPSASRQSCSASTKMSTTADSVPGPTKPKLRVRRDVFSANGDRRPAWTS